MTTQQIKPVAPEPAAVWRHRHVLDVDDFSPEEFELVFSTARAMKEVLSRPIKRVPALRGKTVITLFYEASTRTRLSFELAAKNLGADAANISAPASSVVKGESLLDTISTLEALGADIIVMRHPHSGAPDTAAKHAKAAIINAGDGWHAHPTQALLDLFTILEHKEKIEGLKIAIIGDILHSRVARSNIWGMTRLGAKVTLCGPPTLLPDEMAELPSVNLEHNIERAIEGADVAMALRLQKERQQGGLLPSIEEYVKLYQLTEERLAKAKPEALVMHPGPVNEDIEIASAIVHGPRSVINEQVSNGVAVRMALLYIVAGSQKK